MLEIDGNEFKTQEAADYVYQAGLWMYTSGRADLYDWNKRYCFMQRSVGYIKMASELEPYNPRIIWLDALYSEASEKSSGYMLNLMGDLLSRQKLSAENGYKKSGVRSLLSGLIYGLNSYARMVASGTNWWKVW